MYINDLGVTRDIVGGPNTIPPQSRRKRRPNDLITVRLFMYLERPECTNSIANATIIDCLLYLSTPIELSPLSASLATRILSVFPKD